MDYNKIWSLINKENLSKRAAAKIANMSPYGFNTMMDRKTMSIETLEVLAKYFNVSMCYFFKEEQEDDISLLNDGKADYNSCRFCRDKDVEIQLLNKQLKTVGEKNEKLIKEVGALEHQLKGNNGANGNSEKKAV